MKELDLETYDSEEEENAEPFELPTLANKDLVMQMGRGYRVFSIISLPLLAALFIWLPFTLGMKNGGLGPIGLVFVGLLCTGLVLLILVGLRDAFIEKIVLKNNILYHKSTLSNRSLRLDQINGYRTSDHYLFLEPADSNLKRVKVHKYFQHYSYFETLVANQFPDLDIVEAEQQLAETLNDPSLSIYKSAHESLLKRVRKIAIMLNGAGIVAGLAVFFLSAYYEFIMLALIAIPFISLLVVFRYKGLVRMNSHEKSKHASVIYAYTIPICVLGLRVLMDYNVIAFNEVWYPVSLGAFTILLVLLTGTSEFNRKKAGDYFALLVITLFSGAYILAGSIFINCHYDDGPLEKYAPLVLDKRIGKGKRTSYYLTIEPWGPITEAEEVSVRREFYQIISVGDTVAVEKGEGALGMPWYYVIQDK